MKEFKVNETIILKLENRKTNLYVKGELFRQCKFLLLFIPTEDIPTIRMLHFLEILQNLY